MDWATSRRGRERSRAQDASGKGRQRQGHEAGRGAWIRPGAETWGRRKVRGREQGKGRGRPETVTGAATLEVLQHHASIHCSVGKGCRVTS